MNRKLKNLICRIPLIESSISDAAIKIAQANRELNNIKSILENNGEKDDEFKPSISPDQKD